MSEHRPHDSSLLVQCACRLAELLGAPPPDEACVREIIHKVVAEREALESVALGILTRQEAMHLLLAHLESGLGMPLRDHSTGRAWNDAQLLADVRRGLFGAD